jgi:hypothetical protein
MTDNNQPERKTGSTGLVLGAALAAVAVIFILTTGQLGGAKQVNGDADMPPIATGTTK